MKRFIGFYFKALYISSAKPLKRKERSNLLIKEKPYYSMVNFPTGCTSE